MQYLHWNEEVVKDFSSLKIDSMYEKGYLFTRIGKGVMQQTRSLRIDLKKFSLSSENRRILKRVPDLKIETLELPLYSYDYKIGKMAKDFYDTKFEPGIMSAQKIKEMLTDEEKSNFNQLLSFGPEHHSGLGYAIVHVTPNLIHYSYPFYDLNNSPKDMGLAMIINTILYARNSELQYLYLGSLQRPSDVYKLQFSGLEWFDGEKWSTDTEEVKKLLGQKS